jgi:hypothetical protein
MNVNDAITSPAASSAARMTQITQSGMARSYA